MNNETTIPAPLTPTSPPDKARRKMASADTLKIFFVGVALLAVFVLTKH